MFFPLISVILPTYNGARYIREAIDSVLAQTYKNIELIVIVDASTDHTGELLSEYEDPRIRIVEHDQNQKLVATLNEGIRIARGEYIARIDDDDIWSDVSKLEKQIQLLQDNSSVAIVGTYARIIDDDGNMTQDTIVHASTAEGLRDQFALRNGLIHTSILARKDVFMELGGYDKTWLYVEDYDLWLRVLGAGYAIINIPEYMVSYRVRQGSTTGKKYHRMQWLTFKRLFREKNIFRSSLQRYKNLIIRLILVILPMWIVQSIKSGK